MSLLVLGLSHHRAPISLLEAASLGVDQRAGLAERILRGDNVSEVIVVSTCNRTEVYVEAQTFHGAVNDIGEGVASATGVAIDTLRDHIYIHYEDRAIAHAFQVACGLDSMAVGEAQILGQMRDSLRHAQDHGSAGPALNSLFQQALRVGKRAHSETEIDSVSVSLVEAGLAHATGHLGPIGEQTVLVIGAGGMSGLAAATAARQGAGDLVIVNRTYDKAERLAERAGGRARPLDELAEALAEADIVISSTGSTGLVVDLAAAADAQIACGGAPQAYIDLALPHDIAPEVGSLSDVELVGLERLGAMLSDDEQPPQVREVTDLVVGEVAAFLTSRAADSVGPTVKALRTHAAEVREAELVRLQQRLPDLDEATLAEIQLAMHRVVEKLMHTPTVRVKELTSGGAHDYAAALRELFDLGPHETANVSVPPTVGEGLL
ncbi:glutamyl-tRNA reductase [Actinomycetota bacterium]